MSFERAQREISFDLYKTPTNSSEDDFGNPPHDEIDVASPIVPGYFSISFFFKCFHTSMPIIYILLKKYFYNVLGLVFNVQLTFICDCLPKQ